MNWVSLFYDSPADISSAPSYLLISSSWFLWPLLIIPLFPVPFAHFILLGVCAYFLLKLWYPWGSQLEGNLDRMSPLVLCLEKLRPNVSSINTASSAMLGDMPPVSVFWFMMPLWQPLLHFHDSVSLLFPEQDPGITEGFSLVARASGFFKKILVC